MNKTSSNIEITITAFDEASQIFKQVSDNIDSSLNQISGSTSNLQEQTSQTTQNFSDNAMAMSSVAFAGASMVMTVNNVENAYVRLDRANLMVERSTLAVQKAQESYNAAVDKYGPGSQQAKDAADKLTIAQNALQVSVERQDMSQRALNMDLVFASLSVIPAIIGVVNLMKGALESANISIELTSESLVALASNPIFLLVAGIAAVGVGIYEFIQSQNAAAEAQAKFTAELNAAQTSISDANTALGLYASTTDEFTKKISSLTTAQSDLQSKLADLTKELKTQTDAYDLATAQIIGFNAAWDIARYYEAKAAKVKVDAVQTEIDAVNAKIKATGAEIDITTLSKEAYTAYFDMVTSKTPEYQDNIARMGDALDAYMHQDIAATAQKQVDASTWASISGNESAISEQYYKGMATMVQGFAGSQGKSYADMQKELTTYISDKEKAQAKELADQQKQWDALEVLNSKHISTLQTDLFDKVTMKTDAYHANLEESAAKYNDFLGKSLIATNMVVRVFAADWGISWDQAEKALSSFAEKTNSTIQTDLVGAAQAKFAEFQKCMSGKALTLSTDVQGNMKGMADNITGLIKNGLVGEAQTEMQNYVNCNTNKIGSMTLQLTNDMTTLTKNYKDQLTQMTALADSLTGDQKKAVLKQIDDLTAQYKQKMQQLKDWQTQLLTGMTTDAQSLLGARAVPRGGGQAVNDMAAYAGSSRQVNIHLAGPLVNIEGSADRATVQAASQQVLQQLQNVLIESTSPNAPSSQKSISVPSRMNLGKVIIL